MPNNKRLGRPRKPDAKTPADRSRAYRERQRRQQKPDALTLIALAETINDLARATKPDHRATMQALHGRALAWARAVKAGRIPARLDAMPPEYVTNSVTEKIPESPIFVTDIITKIPINSSLFVTDFVTENRPEPHVSVTVSVTETIPEAPISVTDTVTENGPDALINVTNIVTENSPDTGHTVTDAVTETPEARAIAMAAAGAGRRTIVAATGLSEWTVRKILTAARTSSA